MVWLVEDTVTGDKLALKIIHTKANRGRDKLKKEFAIMKSLPHPNILQVYEFWEDAYSLYIVTELCDRDLEKFGYSSNMPALHNHYL